jgi:DNA topoisomerase-1
VVRVGRYGPYIQDVEGRRAPLPEDLAPDELTVARAEQLLEAGSTERVIGTDPGSGLPIVVRSGRFGPYVQVGATDTSGDGAAAATAVKPVTASLLASMDPATLTLEDALRVLSLPRVVGADPATGEEIVASNGRYGPYLKRGSDSRSLESEEQLFTVGLDEAVALFAQPKTRRGRGATAGPLRELGPDPATGTPIQLKDGRFGPYVTDGVTNASLRKGDTVDGITPERAAELLADRRAAGPRPPRQSRARAGAKSTGTRKAAGTRKATGTRKAAGAAKGAARSEKSTAAGKTAARRTTASTSKAATKKTATKKAATKKAATKKPGARTSTASKSGATRRKVD